MIELYRRRRKQALERVMLARELVNIQRAEWARLNAEVGLSVARHELAQVRRVFKEILQS